MIKKTGTVILTVLAFLVFATLASANTTVVKSRWFVCLSGCFLDSV